MLTWISDVTDRLKGDTGATAVEYAIMAGFIAVVIVGAVALFGQGVVSLFQQLPPGVFGG